MIKPSSNVATNGWPTSRRFLTRLARPALPKRPIQRVTPDQAWPTGGRTLTRMRPQRARGREVGPAPEAPLVHSYPEYADLAADPGGRGVTVGLALTMLVGVEGDDSNPYTGPENSEIAVEMAADRDRFALDRPIVAEPG